MNRFPANGNCPEHLESAPDSWYHAAVLAYSSAWHRADDGCTWTAESPDGYWNEVCNRSIDDLTAGEDVSLVPLEELLAGFEAVGYLHSCPAMPVELWAEHQTCHEDPGCDRDLDWCHYCAHVDTQVWREVIERGRA